MSKLKAIIEVLIASNYIVVTDTQSIGSVSPLYAEKFAIKLQNEQDRQDLALAQHNNMLTQIADDELGERPNA